MDEAAVAGVPLGFDEAVFAEFAVAEVVFVVRLDSAIAVWHYRCGFVKSWLMVRLVVMADLPPLLKVGS